MPTALERKGDFSQTVTTGNNPVQIPVYRSGTKNQYPGNVIPASEFNAFGQKILNFFPLPNLTTGPPAAVNTIFSTRTRLKRAGMSIRTGWTSN